MSEMIERVAQAIEDRLSDPQANFIGRYEAAAKAAIEAIREPTEAMIEAGGKRWRFVDAWRDSIKIALE